MGFVKANFRTKAVDVQEVALGRNIINWLAGSGVNKFPDGFQGGGLVIGSFASLASGGVALISALDVLTSAYGVTYVSNVLGSPSGYIYIPLGFQDISSPSGVTYALSATQAVALADSVAAILVKSLGVLTSISVRFLHFGFLVSSPFQFR